ncbi:hypothetical protein SAMN05428955_0825 [Pseudomonas sp. 7SR1]|nr:hypothetical protein SAMN05428955_0825 [Pseudomonas sp. 7SR1]
MTLKGVEVGQRGISVDSALAVLPRVLSLATEVV